MLKYAKFELCNLKVSLETQFLLTKLYFRITKKKKYIYMQNAYKSQP